MIRLGMLSRSWSSKTFVGATAVAAALSIVFHTQPTDSYNTFPRNYSKSKTSLEASAVSNSFDTFICSKKSHELCSGKNVLLTGASGGLGEAFAAQLARCGASKIILSGREVDRLNKVAKRCTDIAKSNGHGNILVEVITCDLSDMKDVQKLGNKATQICFPGTVDMLINNGGISSRSSFLQTNVNVDELLMKVNFLSGASLAKILAPGMVAKESGTILWISSVQGLVGIPNRTSYAASKFAVQGYCEALRAELASSGVNVHIVSPGYIRTNLSRSAIQGNGSLYGKMDTTTENGADPNCVAAFVLDKTAEGNSDILVATSFSARAAIWLKFFTPSLLQKILRNRFDKS